MTIFETQRLCVRRLTEDDAPFLFELMNDASWLRFIGDRGIRTEADARNNLRQGPIPMYERYGFGLSLVTLKEGGTPLGICGVLKRDSLEDPDLGFAFLPRYAGRGFAREAAQGTLAHARGSLGLRRVVAITLKENVRSVLLLERLGFVFEREIQLTPTGSVLQLYAVALVPGA